MSIFQQLPIFNSSPNVVIEDTIFYQEKFTLTYEEVKKLAKIDIIKSIFNLVVDEDDLLIFIDEYGESLVTFRDPSKIQNQLDELALDALNQENLYTIRIEVHKQATNTIRIYSFSNFKIWFATNSNLGSFFEKISNLEKFEKIYFHVLDQIIQEFSTTKFYFQNTNNSCTDDCRYNKYDLLQIQKEHCHFSSTDKIRFIPDDFKLISRSNDDTINILFDNTCLFLTLTYLANISELRPSQNSIYYKLYGYRSISNEILFTTIITIDVLNQYFGIYEWIYKNNTNSNIADKLGLARNVISLHIKDNNLCNIEGDALGSIKSNFDIYLKDNIKQYLEVKNQVAAFLYEMSIKAESYATSLIDSFKTNFIICISYFLSIIAVTAIDKEKFINVFSTEVTVITLVMLLISWLYQKYSIDDLNLKIERFKKQYEFLKRRYSDILEKDNLTQLFSNDDEHIKDIEYMQTTLAKYRKIWKGSIIVFCLIAISFCIIHDTSDLVEIIVLCIFSLVGLIQSIIQ